MVAPAAVASEVELDLSSLLVAGFVRVINVVGSVVAVGAALDEADASDSVTVTVNIGMVVLMTEVITTGPPDGAMPVAVALAEAGAPDGTVTLQEAASLPHVPKAD